MTQFYLRSPCLILSAKIVIKSGFRYFFFLYFIKRNKETLQSCNPAQRESAKRATGKSASGNPALPYSPLLCPVSGMRKRRSRHKNFLAPNHSCAFCRRRVFKPQTCIFNPKIQFSATNSKNTPATRFAEKFPDKILPPHVFQPDSSA